MPRLQDLAPSDRRRFRSGRPSLDLVHTGGDGPLAVWELLHDAEAVAYWLGVILDVDIIHPGARRTEDVITLRRAIWTSVQRVMAGESAGRDARRTLNNFASRPPLVPELDSQGNATIAAPVTVDQALSTLARDAIDLFGGPLAHRIRSCAAPDCGLLYVDQSRPGTRRWCSMQRCGTLAKVRRHRGRDSVKRADPAPSGYSAEAQSSGPSSRS